MDHTIIKEIKAKSLLRKSKRIDSWFLSRYGMNLYRGCAHNCAYCDGRAEGYYVEGDFGKEVGVKINAPELLELELDPRRKRKPMKKGFIVLSGGVGDSYQEAEKKYRISRKILKIIKKYNFPVHILTKSTSVLDDLDLLKEMNDSSGVMVSFSLSSADDRLSAQFEPCAPSPSDRLGAMKTLRQEGIVSGVFLLPVIPFLSDTPSMIDHSLDAAKQAGASYVLFGGMTLKEGRQQDYFYNILLELYPELLSYYQQIYPGNKWGNAVKDYYETIHLAYNQISSKYNIPKRIPVHLVKKWIPRNDQLVILLEHLHYLKRIQGLKSTYEGAAYRLSELNTPVNELVLRSVDGIGSVTEKLLKEWIKTGRCRQYEELLIT